MSKECINSKGLFPPGGLMIWIVLTAELLAFALALCYLLLVERDYPLLFQNGRDLLNQNLATINTIILISSGYFMAQANAFFAMGKINQKATRRRILLLLAGSATMGVLFLIVKGVEYQEKINMEIGITYNRFFEFYWFLTIFHAIHLILGLVIIVAMAWKVANNVPFKEQDFGFTTGATYWHMCDLIWIMIFPVIYMF
jgi:nitric oxide reductase NorE protein